MENWALIRFHGKLYRLRDGRGEERNVVAELVDENGELHPAHTMTLAANQGFAELKFQYVPHWPATIADLLVKHIGAEFVDWSNPPLQPDEIGRVY